VAEAP